MSITLYCDLELYAEACELVKIVPNASCQILATNDILASDNYLMLRKNGLYFYSNLFKPINLQELYSDFILKRRNGIHNDMLIQAIGVHSQDTTALDITAGLGRDSILMSLAGIKVKMIESNPSLAIILNYLCTKFAKLLPNLQCEFGDSYYLLTANQLDNYDVVYVDPMFNDGKVALAKKDMQLIDLLVTNSSAVKLNYSVEDLFNSAVRHCVNKVIVKRDNKQAPITTTVNATYSKKGKTIRFDIYQCAK